MLIVFCHVLVMVYKRCTCTCNEYGVEHNIRFNRAKSQLMTIGGRGPINSAMRLGKNSVQWVPTVKYLGLHLIGGKYFQSINQSIIF